VGADLVEGHEADVRGGERLDAVGNLLQHLGRVVAAEHGQLVERPVAVVRVIAGRGSQADCAPRPPLQHAGPARLLGPTIVHGGQ